MLLLAALAAAATAVARDPRLEQVRLNAADNALARKVTLRQADVGRTWRKTPLPDSNQQLTCPGFSPNLSRFTITGKAQSAFARATGASIVSAVEVYESRADAVGDFRAAAVPAVARCLRYALERQFSASAVPIRVRSARVVRAPRVGDRRIGYRVIAGLEGGAQQLNIYVDVVVAQRGRSIVALFFTAVQQPLPGQARIAAAVASRMR